MLKLNQILILNYLGAQMNFYEKIRDLFQGGKNIGLALGGGAVYGAAHVGVLRAMQEREIEIHNVAGTSIGAFIGALYANGMDWKEIEKVAKGLKWLDISQLSISKYGLLTNHKFANLVKDCIGEKKFEDCEIPLSIVATDIRSGQEVILNKGSIADAIMASTCIPGVFKPVKLNGQLLVDGGIVENVPITPLRQMGADYLIAVDLNTGISNKEPSNIIEVLVNAFHFTMMTATKHRTDQADLKIDPDLSEFNRFNTSQINALIKKGYQDACEVLDSQFK